MCIQFGDDVRVRGRNQIGLGQCQRRGRDGAVAAADVDVTEQTINNWKLKDPKFFESLKEWKNEADAKVEKTLLQRALGYRYDEVTYEKFKKDGLGVRIIDEGELEEIKKENCKIKIVVKEIIPDVTAQIFWLKNRKPKDWRDRKEHEHSGNINLGLKE